MAFHTEPKTLRETIAEQLFPTHFIFTEAELAVIRQWENNYQKKFIDFTNAEVMDGMGWGLQRNLAKIRTAYNKADQLVASLPIIFDNTYRKKN